MDGFFWKVGAVPSICILSLLFACCSFAVGGCCCVLNLFDGVSGLLAAVAPAAELRESQDDILATL